MLDREEIKETLDKLKDDVKDLKDKMKELIPFGKKNRQVPVRIDRGSEAEHPILSLQRATNQLFDQFFRDFGWPLRDWESPFDSLSTDLGQGWPRLDMSETEDAVRIHADLPGMEQDDIEISLLGNRLTIKGEKKTGRETRDGSYYRMERSYGAFHRSLWLPAEVDRSKVEANYKNGVLTIRLPKTEEAKSQSTRIPVLRG